MSKILINSGALFDVLQPNPGDIRLDDIAHALSNICRFNGHTKEFYSVAQHSLLVSDLVDYEHKLQALMHDAAEAYVGDVVTPVKFLLGDKYRELITGVEKSIAQAFGYPAELSEEVKAADLRALYLEFCFLMPDFEPLECFNGQPPIDNSEQEIFVEIMRTKHIKEDFINKAFYLYSSRK